MRYYYIFGPRPVPLLAWGKRSLLLCTLKGALTDTTLLLQQAPGWVLDVAPIDGNYVSKFNLLTLPMRLLASSANRQMIYSSSLTASVTALG